MNAITFTLITLGGAALVLGILYGFIAFDSFLEKRISNKARRITIFSIGSFVAVSVCVGIALLAGMPLV